MAGIEGLEGYVGFRVWGLGFRGNYPLDNS